MNRPIGLAAQTIPGLAPWEMVEVAAEAGFDRIGVPIDLEAWRASRTVRVRRSLADGGIVAQDAEVVRLGMTAEPERLLDIAAEIGVPYVITVSMIDDAAHTEAGAPILVDPLHLARSGGSAADLARVPVGMLPYVQICDAGPAPVDNSREGLLAEAREARRDIGTGTLDLDAFVAALPADLVLMNECRSQAMARDYPDPLAHARHLATTMRHWLATREERA